MILTLILAFILLVPEINASKCLNGKVPDRVGEWICDDYWYLFEVEISDKETGDVTKSIFFRVPDHYFVDKIRMTHCGEPPKLRVFTSRHDVDPSNEFRHDRYRDEWEEWEIRNDKLVEHMLHVDEYRGFWRQAPLWRMDITTHYKDNDNRCNHKLIFYARAGLVALWNNIDRFRANTAGDASHRSRSKRAVVEAPLSNRCRKVAKIPQRMVTRYQLDTHFYYKYTSAYGIPVMASKFVSSRALQRACYIVRVMLAERKDLRDHLFANRGRLTVIAKNQTLPMVPEMTSYDSWSGRALSGTLDNPVTIIPEEHLLCQIDKYSPNQDILVHELAHAIHLIASRTALPNLDFWINESYQKAKTMGLWNNTYAITSHFEYFAEGVQAYFNRQREGAEGGDGIQNQINTNKELRGYDATLHSIIKGIFPCRNHIIPRCNDLSQKKGLNQEVRMDCRFEDIAPPVSDACVNDRWSCTYWAHIGECSNNPRFMLIYCRHSCQVCNATSATSTAATTPPRRQGQEFPELPVMEYDVAVSQTTSMPASTTIRPCNDEHAGCPTWKAYCETLPHIRKACRLSCQLCVTPTEIYSTRTADVTKCKDHGRNCIKLRARCEKQAIMKRCPMTCGVCSKAQTIDDNAPTNQTREIAGTNNGEDTTATPCVDKKRNCKSRTKTCHKPSAKKYCRFTCNLCNRPTSTERPETVNGLENTTGVCIDSNNHCESWVSRCTSNNYVARNCRKTCGFCRSRTGARELSTTTQSPEVDDCICKDIDLACSSWTAHCGSNRYLKSHCKRTCHFCDIKSERKCRKAKRMQ